MSLVGFLSGVLIISFSVLLTEAAYFQDTADRYFGADKLGLRLHRIVAYGAATFGMIAGFAMLAITPASPNDIALKRVNGYLAFGAAMTSAFAGTVLFNIGYQTYRDVT